MLKESQTPEKTEQREKATKTEEDTGKVGIKREEVIDALRSLEGVKRKLKKALDSA